MRDKEIAMGRSRAIARKMEESQDGVITIETGR